MRLATLSTWRGYPLWTCALCGRTTTTKDRMRQHIQGNGAGGHNVRVEYAMPDPPDEGATESDAQQGDTKPATPATRETTRDAENSTHAD